jgi:hypothetical protein
MAWITVIVLVAAGFWLPVLIAAVRGTVHIGLVVTLTVLALGTGVTWFAAMWAACTLPRARPAAPYPARPW